METRTTLDANIKVSDYRTIIKKRLKRKMNNNYPCRFSYGGDVIAKGRLSFCSELAYVTSYLLITSPHRIFKAEIPLPAINGSNTQGAILTLTLDPDIYNFQAIFQFRTEEICQLAFTAFEEFERNPTRQPTPSTSSASSNEAD